MSELEIVRHAQIDGLSMFFNTVEYRTPPSSPGVGADPGAGATAADRLRTGTVFCGTRADYSV